jgi:hypothetical protein
MAAGWDPTSWLNSIIINIKISMAILRMFAKVYFKESSNYLKKIS